LEDQRDYGESELASFCEIGAMPGQNRAESGTFGHIRAFSGVAAAMCENARLASFRQIEESETNRDIWRHRCEPSSTSTIPVRAFSAEHQPSIYRRALRVFARKIFGNVAGESERTIIY
jgi:hypothetical protein